MLRCLTEMSTKESINFHPEEVTGSLVIKY